MTAHHQSGMIKAVAHPGGSRDDATSDKCWQALTSSMRKDEVRGGAPSPARAALRHPNDRLTRDEQCIATYGGRWSGTPSHTFNQPIGVCAAASDGTPSSTKQIGR